MSRELDPEAQAALDRLSEYGAPPLHTLSVDGARRMLLDLSDTEPRQVANESVTELWIPGLDGDEFPIRVYSPDPGHRCPILVYYHGGGWALGSLDSVDALCRVIATVGNVLVVSVGYRRAPENRFPTAINDAYTAVTWVAQHGELIGGNPSSIGVGGDSAGGNLAAAVALLARDREGPLIDYQLLVYPVLDYSFDTGSYEENKTGYYLTRADMEWFWNLYLGDPVHGANPYASPLRHPNFEGLPAAYVLTCEFDPLRDEGQAYASRLREAGVEVTERHYEGMIHGFFRHVTRMESARTAAEDAATELSESLTDLV